MPDSRVSERRKLLLIGWDAADWRVIRPLLEAGKMPNLKALLKHGASGNLETLNPPLSPMLWTSIASGKRPFKHGIHGFTEPDPTTGFIRPITSRSRKVKAFWNILSQQGLKTNVIGWWPSHPAESIDGVMVSNQFHTASKPLNEAWPVLSGAVYPASMESSLAELRVHPGELTGEDLLPFVPAAKGRTFEADSGMNALAKTTAECVSIQAMATELMDTTDWDCTAVYFDGIDHYGHGFMKYHPPRRPHIKEDEFELYQNVMTAAYQFHDSMLGVLVAKAGPGTTVMLLSDHGFHPDDLRPNAIPAVPAGPAAEHRSQGILVMAGPGVKVGEPIYGASLLDICPTLLHLFDLPVARDMDGRSLQQVLATEDPPEMIDSWESVAGKGGMHESEVSLSPEDSKAALQQLVDLGYIEAPDDDKQEAVDRTIRELRYNLGCSYLDANRYNDAGDIFQELYEAHPNEYRYGLRYISCLKAMARHDAALEAIEVLLKRKHANMKTARAELDEYRQKVKEKTIDPSKMTRAQSHKIRQLRAEASINEATVTLLKASSLEAKGDKDAALQALESIKAQGVVGLEVQIRIASIYTKLKRYAESEEALLKALEIDDEDASVRVGLAENYLAWRHNFNAAAEAMKATELSFYNPRAHYIFGVALLRLGKIQPAIDALQLAVSQNPLYPQAHRRLAFIYEKRRGDRELADKHGKLARQARARIDQAKRQRGFVSQTEALGEMRRELPEAVEAPFAWWSEDLTTQRYRPEEVITIVSGLPRSGTSLMMQLLEAAGCSAMTDAVREADNSNPRGYFEYEPVKELGLRACDWMDAAKERSLKVIAQLLVHLPATHRYRVIFMLRDLDEIVESQRIMLQRLKLGGAGIAPARMRAILEGQLIQVSRMLEKRNIPLLLVAHVDCLQKPESVALRLSQFLDRDIGSSEVAKIVDQSLYRTRK